MPESPTRQGAPRASERTADRRITAGGLWVAGAFLVLAIASAGLPAGVRQGDWLPLHLALAGAAAQAIGAALPFFTASLLAGRPAPPVLRASALALLAAGGLAVSGGVASDAPTLAASGGVAFVAGIGLLAVATFLPLRRALGSRYPWVLAAYAAALGNVALGASLATLEVAGFLPVVTDWAWLKPAHAWLNLLGFVSLVISGTLLHLYPTVVGSRIAGGSWVRTLVLGLGLGAPLVAGGYLLRSDPLGRIGAAVELTGAVALIAYVVRAWRVRGRWTGDLAWRTVVIGGLSGGVAWFAVAVFAAAGRVLVMGTEPVAWSLAIVGVPLAAGWMAQSMVGAWTHLLPAISGGSPGRHATQRRVLGWAATPRVVALNAGVALLTVGMAASSPSATLAGAAVVAAVLVLSLALLAVAASSPEPSRPA